MKAAIYTEYGSPDVLEIKELEKPSPKENEVLVKINAASINSADDHMLRADPFFLRFDAGLQKPKNQILGADIAGRIEAVGSGVSQFKVGDEVFGDTSGYGFKGFAEYAVVREDLLALKPQNLSFEEAAAVPMAGLTALQGLRDKGQIQAGQKVLIYGASGGVGSFAIQLAKYFGAEVTAVCSSRKTEMVKSLGADFVIDYQRENFAKNGKKYDLILAANGDRSIFDYKKALNPNGIYVVTGGSMGQIFQGILLGPILSIFGKQKLTNLMAAPSQKDLAFMKELIEAGKIKPLVDKAYPLQDIVEAFHYFASGQAQGKIVITMEDKKKN